MRSKTCPKCQGSMVEGFIATERHSMPGISSWHEGPPKRQSWWGGIRLSKSPLPIATMRCSRCGFLENYARKVD